MGADVEDGGGVGAGAGENEDDGTSEVMVGGIITGMDAEIDGGVDCAMGMFWDIG